MKLIGMLDSPYVRRVAISFQLLGVPFEHQSLSVFRAFEQFRAINPAVKAPTLVCDDGTVLMDSTLIIDHGEHLPGIRRSLMPTSLSERTRVLHVLGLALAACEKAVQIIYERNVRPPEKLHQPWVDRVDGQMHAAFGALERWMAAHPPRLGGHDIDQGTLTTAVVWHFASRTDAKLVDGERYPVLQALSLQAESLPAFRAAPHGDGTYPVVS